MREKSLLLDSDVVIDIFRGVTAVEYFIDSFPGELFISVYTYLELINGAKNKSDVIYIDKEVSSTFPVISGSESLEHEAVRIFKNNKLKSNIGIIDSFIAATAVVHDLPLVTKNIKHYQGVTNLKLIKPY